MNTSTTRKLLLITAMMAAIGSAATAQEWFGQGHVPESPRAVPNREEAAKLPVGTKVALACKACQGRNIQTVDKKKTFLAWFDPNATQKCDGCGGAMQMRRNPHGNHNTHVCSKCGENSAAAVCAAMRKKAKS